MSAHLSTQDIPSEDLDLNSKAVFLDDQDETVKVCASESSVSNTVPVAETLAEEEGEDDEVRVSDGDCAVEPLNRSCDVREEVAQVDVLASGEARGGSESEEKKEAVNEVVKADVTKMIANSAEESEAVVEGQVAVVENEGAWETKNEVSGVGTLDGNLSSCADKSQAMEAQVVGECTGSFRNEDRSYKEDDSMQDERVEAVDQVDELVSDPVDGNERMESWPVDESTNEGPCIEVDSKFVPAVSMVSEAAGTSTSLHSENEAGHVQVDNSSRDWTARELGSELQATESLSSVNKEQKTEIETAKMETPLAITDLDVEQIQVATVESQDVSEISKEDSQTDALDTDMPCPKENQRYEAELPGRGIESLPNGDLLNKSDPCVQDIKEIKEEKASSVAEMVPNQVDEDKNLYLHLVEENLHGEASATLDSSMVNSELLVEKTDEDIGGQVAVSVAEAMDISETKCDTSEVHSLDENPSGLENIHRLDAVVLGENIDSFPEESARNKDNSTEQNLEKAIATEVTETVSMQVDEDKSKDSHPTEENRPEAASIIPDQIPLPGESDGSQATDLCSSLQLESEVGPPQYKMSLGPLEEGNSNSEVQIATCHTSQDQKLKEGSEVIKIDSSTATKSLVQEIEDTVRMEVVVMNNEEASVVGDEISEINELDGNPCFSGQNHISENEVLDGSTKSCSHEHLRENTLVEDVQQEMATEIVSTDANVVDRQGKIDSLTVNENQTGGANLAVGSDSHVMSTDACQASGSAASLHGDGEHKSLQVTSAWLSETDISNLEVRVAEDNALEEKQKAENKVEKVENEMETTESLVEQSQLVREQGAAMEQVRITEDEVSVTDDLDGNCPCMEKNQMLEDVAVGSTEPAPNGDLSYQQNLSEKDEEQERANLVTETGHCQIDEDDRMDLYPSVENVNGEGASDVHIDNQSLSACATDTVEASAEVQVTEGLASPTHKDLIRTGVSEIDTSPGENEDELDAAGGGPLKVEERQISESHVSSTEISQVSGNKQIIAGVVENLECFSATDGKSNAEDDSINKSFSHPGGSHVEEAIFEDMVVDMEFSELDQLDENAVDGARCLADNEILGTAYQASGFQQLDGMEKQSIESATLEPESDSECEYAASYSLAPEKEGEFSVSDLVWGKVKSHPWWPGQIFDCSESSEQALRYQKKDSLLVAYFGDQTFAWNDTCSLKPFRTHFPQMEKQSSSETFRTAVDSALNEVQRRVEIGMACSCTPKEVYDKVKAQVIENAGIREEARRRDRVDKSLSVDSFEPDKLVMYIKALGLDPCGACDRLGLVIAQAQLKAFYSLKGFDLPDFHVYGGFSETDLDSSFRGGKRHCQELFEQHGGRAKLKSQGSYSRKRKHVWEDGLYPIRKEKGLLELMAGNEVSLSPVVCDRSMVDEQTDTKPAPSSMKRKAETSVDDSAVKTRKEILSPSRDADTESPATQSFKVGECIRRIASKMTGSPPILKCSGERYQKVVLKMDRNSEKQDCVGGSPYISEESQRRRFVISKECSLEEMLSQLCLAACEPVKGDSSHNAVIGFFTEFRNSICISSSWKHRKSEKMDGAKTCTGIRPSDAEIRSAKTFDFEDINDSYWTDRVIQSSPEEQPCMNQKSKGKSQVDPLSDAVEPDSTLLLNPTCDSNEQGHDGNHDLMNEKPTRKYRRRRKSQLEFPANMDTPMDSKQQNSYCDRDLVPVSNLNEVPTALILSFAEVDSIPSERNLNKIFSRFGPLKESETEVMRDTSSARVVFKKRTDAEVACSSAGKFSIFGPTTVTYQLMYLPLATQLKASFHSTTDGQKDA